MGQRQAGRAAHWSLSKGDSSDGLALRLLVHNRPRPPFLLRQVLTRFARLTCGALLEYLGLPRSLVPLLRLGPPPLPPRPATGGEAGGREGGGARRGFEGRGGGTREALSDAEAMGAAQRLLSEALQVPPPVLTPLSAAYDPSHNPGCRCRCTCSKSWRSRARSPCSASRQASGSSCGAAPPRC